MPRVSLFIDGENLPARHAARILEEAGRAGQVDLRRVYGDAGRLAGWEAVPGLRVMHAGTGKNAADLLLCVEAMARALSGGCEVVAIASADGDFRHLAGQLVERGITVIGLGDARAPQAFRAACSRFVLLAEAGDAQAGLAPKDWPAAIARILAEEGGDGGMSTARLGQLMRQRHGVCIGAHADRTWRGYLSKRAGQFRLEPVAGGLRVFLRRDSSLRIAAE
jgi:hypothetical protein